MQNLAFVGITVKRGEEDSTLTVEVDNQWGGEDNVLVHSL